MREREKKNEITLHKIIVANKVLCLTKFIKIVFFFSRLGPVTLLKQRGEHTVTKVTCGFRRY